MTNDNNTQHLVCTRCGDTWHGRWPHWLWTQRDGLWFHCCQPMQPRAYAAEWREQGAEHEVGSSEGG